MPLIAGISRAGAWTIVDGRIARRLRVNAVAYAVIALGRCEYPFGFDHNCCPSRFENFRVLPDGVDMEFGIWDEARGDRRANLASCRVEVIPGRDGHFDRTAIVRQVIIHLDRAGRDRDGSISADVILGPFDRGDSTGDIDLEA